MKNAAGIPTAYYRDQDIYQKEQEALFQNCWQFFGFDTEVKEHNAYLCRDVGGRSIFVQNFRGSLNAFLNVCSHRFSRIRNSETGTGSLTCPYHGWSYDDGGIPTAIPTSSQFDDLSQERRQELRLERWSIDTCGQFIFVKRHDDGLSLKQYLGDTYDLLEKISSALGEKLDLNRYTIRSNWKIAVENALEAYHVPLIHPNSFSRLGTSGLQFEYSGPHSSWKSDVSQQMVKKWQLVEKYYASRPFHINGYMNHLIFPNVTVVTLFGATFSVQHFKPVSPSETECSSHVFATTLAEPSSARAASAVIASMNSASVEFNRTVFGEDKSACELVQLGVEQYPKSKGALGKEEERVSEFQRAYRSHMASALQ